MDATRWKIIKEIFDSAARRPAFERTRYLSHKCGGDPELRYEVESLLYSVDAAGSFMEFAPVAKIAGVFEVIENELKPGQSLGRYRVLEMLGSGGMGNVYLAEDTSLRRKVALKVLSEKIAGDKLILQRFEQEALAVSALNHPNILTIFEIAESEGSRFIVSEYVAGDTLRKRIGDLSVREALEIALQVASALEAAHGSGVVHRDIKPENIVLRDDGLIKVLDFGLAKLTARNAGFPDREAETLPFVETIPGMILGTASYMSPEQARGQAVDERTDIWSLGVLLFEMLTGRVPFDGETVSHTIVSILEDAPPQLAGFIAGFPPGVEVLISEMLAKSPEERYLSAGEISAELRAMIRRLDFESELLSQSGASPGAEERARAKRMQPRTPLIAQSSGAAFRERQELVGRESEIAELTELLRRPEVRLATLTGIGGTGKTRLAQAVASRLEHEFADGIYFIELSCVSDPALVISAIAQDLDVPEVGDDPVMKRLQEHLADKRILLTLDNLEQVVGAATHLAELLEDAPKLKIFATSRERLHLSSEVEYPVLPLPLPPDTLQSAEEIRRFEAVRLFERRARAANPSFELSDENAAAVAEICSRLDGLPLAIELAAARTRLLSPATILSRLDDRLALLTGGAKDLPARQQTMRGAIEWSYDLLDDCEKSLFRRLSVFADGFTPSVAEAVVGSSPSGVSSAPASQSIEFIDLFSSLADKNLLVPRGSLDGERRFGMLAVVREYAVAELGSSGEADAVRGRHAEYYLELAEKAEPHLKSAGSAEWLHRLEEEHDNLRAALRWSIENDPKTAARLAAGIRYFWTIHGHLYEGRHWSEEILSRDIEMPPEIKWKILIVYGNITQFQGDIAKSQSLYEESLAVSRQSGDDGQVAQSLRGLGALAYMNGDTARARKLIEEAIAISRRSGDKFGLAASLGRLGDIAQADHDLIASRSLTGEALAIFRELGYKEGISAKLNNLGATVFLLGEHERAEEHFREALGTAIDLGEKINTRLIFDGFAALAAERGDFVRAARLSGVAEGLGASIGYAVEPAEAIFREVYLGKLRSRLGDDIFNAEREAGRKLTLEQATKLTG